MVDTTNRAERHQGFRDTTPRTLRPLCVACVEIAYPNGVRRGVTARCVDIALFYFSEGMSAPVLLFQLARRGVCIPMIQRCSSLSARLFWLPHRGGTMQGMSLPECLGTVVVHRGDAVTCTRDSCARDLTLESWFSHHTSFVTCSNHNCPHCGFEAPVQWGTDGNSTLTTVRRRRGGRLLEPAFRRHV